MLVGSYHRTWDVHNEQSLELALASRDSRGGGVFWLEHMQDKFPKLAIRVSGDVADVHYFPTEDHPGFRVLGGKGLPEGGMTTLIFDGCDPGTGEDTPNEFVLTLETARATAMHFFQTGKRWDGVEWCEL